MSTRRFLLLSTSRPLPAEKVDALKASLAEQLGVEPEDVVVVPESVSVTVVEAPARHKPKAEAEEHETAHGHAHAAHGHKGGKKE